MTAPSHPRAIVWQGREIPWQNGPVREDGINGIQADDVLGQVLTYLEAVNVEPYVNEHTSTAIAHIDAARRELRLRTAEREAAGTEGTSQP